MRKKDRELVQESSEELDQASRISKADIERAAARWQKHAPPRFKNLLKAKRTKKRRSR